MDFHSLLRLVCVAVWSQLSSSEIGKEGWQALTYLPAALKCFVLGEEFLNEGARVWDPIVSEISNFYKLYMFWLDLNFFFQ